MEPNFALNLSVPRLGSRARFKSVLEQLVAAIQDGRLRGGIKLPATREMARIAGVSRNTAVAVYEALAAQGLAMSKPGAGTFVVGGGARVPLGAPRAGAPEEAADHRVNRTYAGRKPERPSASAESAYDFRIGMSDWRSFPWDTWRRLTARVLRSPTPRESGYIAACGPRSLREALSAQVSVTRAISCDPRSIVITNGAQQAFDLLSRILVTHAGALVAVENPGYAPSRGTFTAAGAGLVPVDVDEQGMLIEKIPPDVRVVSVTPSHQYPLGSQMSVERRLALLRFARDHDSVIIEDDYDGEFRFKGRSIEALKTLDRDDRVFYVGTFSKSLFPSLRLGFVIAPAWAQEPLAYAKQCADLHSHALSQYVLANFISEGHMARHLVKMRQLYQRRCEMMVDSLQRHMGDSVAPYVQSAGLHFVATLPEATDTKALLSRCAAGGLSLTSLENTWVHQPRWPMMGLGYGAIPERDIDAGIRRLRTLASLP